MPLLPHARPLMLAAAVALSVLIPAPMADAQTEPPPSGAEADRSAVTEYSFRTRPDLHPPSVSVDVNSGGTDSGQLFLSTIQQDSGVQNGVFILDDEGELVWSRPVADLTVGDFKPVTFRGAPALTWFEGRPFLGPGKYQGEWVVVDDTYSEVARVNSIGYESDIHDIEFVEVEGDQHAIFIIYHPVTTDLTEFDGQPDATVIDLVIQEVNLDTNTVVFEWSALEDIPFEDSFANLTADVVDYVHGNSVRLDSDGDLLVSARTTSAIYKIDRDTGDIVWTLGGKDSDFAFPNDDGFAFQHDAQRRADGTIGLFDNSGPDGYSRGVEYELDLLAMTALRTREFRTTPGHLGSSMGNAQELPNGNTLVGWGSGRRFTEFDSTGGVLYDATIPSSASYRIVRGQWTASPTEPPRLALSMASPSQLAAHMSWNGATELADWKLQRLPNSGGVIDLGTASRDGFETVISVSTAGLLCSDQYRAVAMASDQTILATTAPISRPGCSAPTGAIVYGAGKAPDRFSDGSALRPITVTGDYQPLVGNFLGDGDHTSADEVFWYAPGPAFDHLWSLDDARPGVSVPTTTWVTPVNGTYVPIVGNFGGADCDDIFWYAAGAAPDYLWISPCSTPDPGTAPVFTSFQMRVNGDYRPLVGRFDGSVRDQIFWYASGSAVDYLWTFSSSGSTATSARLDVNGRYRPLVIDLEGDERSEIFWYASGPAPDHLWRFSGSGSTRSRASSRHDVNGNYLPVTLASGGALSGNPSSGDEILWYAAGPRPDYVWQWNGSGFDSSSSAITGDYEPVVGRFTGCDATEGIWWHRAGGGHVWTTTGGVLSSRPDGVSVGGTPLAVDLQDTGCST